MFFWATRNHARNHALPPCCTHCCCYWQDTHYTETGNMDKGGGTHTHTAVATAEEAGRENVWLSGVHRRSLLFSCFRCSTLPPALSLGEGVPPTSVCVYVAHTTQRERGGSRVCPMLLLLLAVGGGSERRDIGWLCLCGSIGVVLLLCSRRREHLAAAEAGGGTYHTTHQQQRSFLDDGVLLTAVLCTSLHSLWARGCVASAAAAAAAS